MRRVLVTGASTWAGGRLIQSLERRAGQEVHAVDALVPSLEFNSEFHQVELDTPEFVSLLLDLEPETVVHLQTIDRSAQLGRSRAHEEAVVGAQTLFGAIGRCKATKQVVVKSDAAFYGAGPRNPSVFAEDTVPQGRRVRFSRDLGEMERRVAGMQEAHPDVTYTTLRFAPIFGSEIANAISRYLRLKIVPTRMGFDPRLQLIHEQDAVRAIEHTVFNPVAGTFNIAAPGQLYLNRIVRIGGRIRQPLPRRPFEMALRALGRMDLYMPAHLADIVRYGLVMDVTRMHDELGFVPRFNARQTVLAGYGLVDSGAPR
jgi:UDP-glucose 4-epimerase